MADFQMHLCRKMTVSGRAACWMRSVATAALVGLWAPAAGAEVLLFSANSAEQTFTSTGLFDFNGTASGGTALTFSTTQANQRVVFIFDATCFISDRAGGAVVNIRLDPAGPTLEYSVPPTNGVANGGALIRFVDPLDDSATRTTVVASARPSQAGTHTVKVRVTPRGDLSGGDPATVTLQAASLTVLR